VTGVTGTHAGAIERKRSCWDGAVPDTVTGVTTPSLRLAVQSRVLVDNDWSGDPDGLVALAHHLLSPTNRVVAVTSSMINPVFGQPEGAANGAALARELVDLIALPESPPVHAGSNGPFGDSASAAADAIVAEARRDDDLPLFLVCAGPLTNVAQALQQAPDIAARLTLVWIGGALDAAADEYNRDTDLAAAEFVLATPGLAVWQFPLETYRSCAYSVAELEADLAGSGRIGEWLWTRFAELPLPDFVRLGGVWPLGDSPPVLVTALDDESSTWRTTPNGRIYTAVDVRLLFADMLAKLRLHERRR
jgi:purine nucleosidase